MTEKKPHGNTKAPEDRASAVVFVRCKESDKAAWLEAAGTRHLSKWIVDTLNLASRPNP